MDLVPSMASATDLAMLMQGGDVLGPDRLPARSRYGDGGVHICAVRACTPAPNPTGPTAQRNRRSSALEHAGDEPLSRCNIASAGDSFALNSPPDGPP